LLLSPRSELPSVFPVGSQLATCICGLLQPNKCFPSLPNRARAGYSANAPQLALNTGQGQGSSSDPRAAPLASTGFGLQGFLRRALAWRGCTFSCVRLCSPDGSAGHPRGPRPALAERACARQPEPPQNLPMMRGGIGGSYGGRGCPPAPRLGWTAFFTASGISVAATVSDHKP
jgi:hypothetical protein